MEAYFNPRADWSLIPEHMRHGVSLYVMHGVPGGSFMTAVFSGAPLTEVVGRADIENQRALVGWATFVYNYVPQACHGSPEKVAAWIESGGLVGQREAA